MQLQRTESSSSQVTWTSSQSSKNHILDMIPNEHHKDGINLFSNVRQHSTQKLYTTFIGTDYYSMADYYCILCCECTDYFIQWLIIIVSCAVSVQIILFNGWLLLYLVLWVVTYNRSWSGLQHITGVTNRIHQSMQLHECEERQRIQKVCWGRVWLFSDTHCVWLQHLSWCTGVDTSQSVWLAWSWDSFQRSPRWNSKHIIHIMLKFIKWTGVVLSHTQRGRYSH
jgi:hypothetical protein